MTNKTDKNITKKELQEFTIECLEKYKDSVEITIYEGFNRFLSCTDANTLENILMAAFVMGARAVTQEMKNQTIGE